MDNITLVVLSIVVIGIFLLILSSRNKKKKIQQQLAQKFPDAWRDVLQAKVIFYEGLDDADKRLFEKRIQLFIATKNIQGIDTDIDDSIRLMVASSAVIPTFAFSGYNYPRVQTVLIYPNSFDSMFQTERFDGHKQNIMGMVGNQALKGTVILSKPDLVKAFDGRPHKENVGVHEFVHLLDMEDGAVDGIPELLIEKRFVGPWLHEIKKEIKKIEAGTSDINPYALTNNGEFLAVVSEYFFDNPEKFHRKHPDLYTFLSGIYNKDHDTQTQAAEQTKG